MPQQILVTLFPYLKAAARYAHQIQPRIAARPEKEGYESFLGAALSDADLSIQTMIEVALLGTFPDMRFFGEEFDQSYNTKYFRAITLGEKDDYLVTLDPIDGTRYYLDGHDNFQIILAVLNSDEFEAVIAVTPAQNTFTYALRGAGCWQGSLDDGLDDCDRLQLEKTAPVILLGWGMEWVSPKLQDHYLVIDIATSYSQDIQIPNVNGLLQGEVAGVIVRSGKFIDTGALAFMAQEAGCIVTTFEGTPPPPLDQCDNFERPGLVIAVSEIVHQDLLAVVRGG
jgi:fructose-1,6-bisphosphatase/inositol monophosphatase family enzyme